MNTPEVPNVPCGVESSFPSLLTEGEVLVPNVPCGVESFFSTPLLHSFFLFLMYRVELKD